ncbi:MAG: hypothetical protein FD167_2853 [bacterium]|nr:MAG: hypothetical protein FD167_2853 [bacterium]
MNRIKSKTNKNKEETIMNTKNQNTESSTKTILQTLIGIPLSALIHWLFMFGATPNLKANRGLSC